ncbi:MAG TPA: hypothetical protein VEU28_02190, partial [Actinomycetota bacterium]|nr:hypothetical protein [Actinomycetota bacterium]
MASRLRLTPLPRRGLANHSKTRPTTPPGTFAGDEIPQLSSIFYNWQKEDSEEPRPTVNRIESTVVGLLSSIESWKRDILQAADQQEERLSDGLRSIQALVTQAQSANSEVEQGIYQALAALWDKTAELGTGLEGWSAESRRLDSEHAHTVRALEALNARIAGLEESSEQRQETLTQHLGALVEALKETLGDADKFSHQMQARVLRGLEAVDERIALRQQEAHQAIFNELTVLHQSTAAKLEDEAARRTSEAATTQARAHAEILTALEMTARQAAEAEAAAELTSRAGHTATQAV